MKALLCDPEPPARSAAAPGPAELSHEAPGVDAGVARTLTRREQLLEASKEAPVTRRQPSLGGASSLADSDAGWSDSESTVGPEQPSPTPWGVAGQPLGWASSSSGAMQLRTNPSYMLPESPSASFDGAAGATPPTPAHATGPARYAPPQPPQPPAWTRAAAAEAEEPPVLMLPPSAAPGAGAAGAGDSEVHSGPALPAWATRRPFLTGEHLGAAPSRPPPAPQAGHRALREHPPAVQELLLLDDLLYAMLGADGRFVRAVGVPGAHPGAPKSVRFLLDGDADAPLAELARRLLPLCDDAACVAAFCESRSRPACGLTAHACAAALRSLLRDWRALAVQLEHQLRAARLSLQAAWFYAQPAQGALRLLASVAAAAAPEGCRGALLLNTLHRAAAAAAGDEAASQLLQQLLAASAAPYCAALGRWVYEGVVEDPYGEFLVQQAGHLSKESLAEDYTTSYWVERYTLRGEAPLFLSAATAQKALTSGRYLNAIRECGRPLVCPFAASAPIEYDPTTCKHVERIDAAFAFASRELLALVFGQHALGARLRSLKHYFLLDQGDFLVHFLDSAGEELSKPTVDIALPKLQSLLEMALRQSTAAADAHHDDLVCGLERSGIIAQLLSIFAVSEDAGGEGGAPAQHEDGVAAAAASSERMLTGMETFTLDYRVSWPLSLVISRRALTKYQLIFRHLFHCRHVERQLGATWQLHQSTRRIAGPGGRLGRAYCLCQRMLHFLQNFMYYMTVEVIEPNWAAMDVAIRGSATIDEVIEAHDRFLDACMKEGMLFWPKILKRLERIKSICLRFAAITSTFAASLAPPSSPPASPRHSRRSSVGGVMQSPSGVAGGGAAFGVGADRAQGFGHKSRTMVAEDVLNMNAAAAEPGFAAAMRALEAQFDTQLRELRAALNASSHLEPHLSSLAFRLLPSYDGPATD